MTTDAYITCRELIEFLDAYVANELAAERRHEFDRHLSVCPSCVAYLHSYRETIRLTRAADDVVVDAPSAVIAAILAAIRRAE